MQQSSSEDWLVAAHLLRPQGRRGELLAEPHVPFELFTPGRPLWLGNVDGTIPCEVAPRVLDAAWQPVGRNAGRAVLKLLGVDTISDAEALNGRHLLLRSSDLPALPEDTFRVRDLLGCSLFNGGQHVGEIVDVQFPVAADGRTRLEDAPDLLAVLPGSILPQASEAAEPEAPEPVLIPFVRAWLRKADIAAKRIDMQLPPGLFGTLDGE